jgi:tRNA-splicing ligase RtcB (3'-phosphate/5'-hydroxy nucleic acid ligase)
MSKTRRIDEYEWELPIGFVDGMRVPGRVFASRELFDKALDDRAAEQVANVATLPGIVGASFAMPDIHWGYGFPIGGVAATDPASDGVLSPGGVGFDIGCGVRLVRTDLTQADLDDSLREVVDALGNQVPRGVGGRGRLPIQGSDIDRVLTEGVAYAIERGAGWSEDGQSCEDLGTLPDADASQVSERAKERGRGQLGSLGAGNHFLEIQIVDDIRERSAAELLGLVEGQVCVMIHSGSRGVGHQTCTDYLRSIDRLGNAFGYAPPDRQLACVPLNHELAESYRGAMNACGNFALANRQVLMDGVRAAFESVFQRSARDLGMQLVYDVSHNLAKLEEHSIDGTPRPVCVHRKGATRAFGPSHPDLPERFRSTGQPVLIPGSMGTSSFVLTGTDAAATKSFSSTCHGAGRAMSRTKAKKQMSGQELRKQLESAGIALARTRWKLLSEEAPYAYKDAEDVVAACEGAGLSRVVARLRPVGVVKG